MIIIHQLQVLKSKIKFISNLLIISYSNYSNSIKDNKILGNLFDEESKNLFNIKKGQILTKNNLDDIIENNIKNEEFISEENFELIKGNIYNILTSQNGSRIIQTCISKTSIEVMKLFFLEIKDKLHLLINDQYGNYFCKKFFCSITDSERIGFLESVIFLFFIYLDI